MPQLIEVPGMGTVEFPDGMSDDQISAAIQKNMPKQSTLPGNMSEDMKGWGQLGNIGAGLKQGAYDWGDMGNKAVLNIARMAGVDKNLPVKYEDYKKFSDADKAAYEASPEGQSGAGKTTRFLMNTLPYALVPGGASGGLLARMLTGAAANAGIGAVNDVADNNSFPINTILGGATGAAIPATLGAAKFATTPVKAAWDFVFPKGKVLGETAKIIGNDMGNVVNTKQAGERLGLHLTPAEASGNPLLAEMQGRAGTSEEGAQSLYQFGKNHMDQQKSAVSGLINEVSPNSESAAMDIRNTSKRIIDRQEKALSNKAKPMYEAAYKEEVNPKEIQSLMSKDPNVEDAINYVTSDRRFAVENLGYPKNSIKILDQAKKRIDAQIEGALRNGDKHLASVLQDSKKRLLSATDNLSENYKLARSTYGEGAGPLQVLRESNIGKIANMSDIQTKNISKVIFDPAQTDIKVIGEMRDKISKQSPGAWNQIVRNEMERRLDKTEGLGNNFYNKILKGNRDFNQFLTATKSIPGAQQKIIDMRAAFKNILNPTSVKTSAGLAKSSLNVPRSTFQAVKDIAENLMGGRYDKAFIDFVTNPKWDKELSDYMKKSGSKNVYQKAINYGSILGKIAASSNIEEGR